VFELTAAGAAAVDGWLRQPVDRLREVRLEFMLKLYFLHRLDPAAEKVLLGRQIEAVGAYIDRAAARLSGAPAQGFERLVLGSKVTAGEATLAWLQAYARELGLPAVADRAGPGAVQ